jgi:hypothetical protein
MSKSIIEVSNVSFKLGFKLYIWLVYKIILYIHILTYYHVMCLKIHNVPYSLNDVASGNTSSSVYV